MSASFDVTETTFMYDKKVGGVVLTKTAKKSGKVTIQRGMVKTRTLFLFLPASHSFIGRCVKITLSDKDNVIKYNLTKYNCTRSEYDAIRAEADVIKAENKATNTIAIVPGSEAKNNGNGIAISFSYLFNEKFKGLPAGEIRGIKKLYNFLSNLKLFNESEVNDMIRNLNSSLIDPKSHKFNVAAIATLPMDTIKELYAEKNKPEQSASEATVPNGKIG